MKWNLFVVMLLMVAVAWAAPLPETAPEAQPLDEESKAAPAINTTEVVTKQAKENKEDKVTKKAKKAKRAKKAKKAKKAKRARKLKAPKDKFAVKLSETNLSEAALKIKQARSDLAEKQRIKSKRFNRKLRRLRVSPQSFEDLGEARDPELGNDFRSLKQEVEHYNPQLFVHGNPEYKYQIKKVKHKIEKRMTRQMQAYLVWRKLSWSKIESVWKQKGIYFLQDDKLNREEHEKLFQLFVIEESDKLQFLLPLLDAQKKLVESINRGITEIENEKYVKLAIKLMTKQLVKEYIKRFKAYKNKHHQDFGKEVAAMDKEMMKAFNDNIRFNQMASI